MSGVGWDERADGDWLASNGRWYPSSSRPRGWSRTALPPAPDHLGHTSVVRGMRSRLEEAAMGASERLGDVTAPDEGTQTTSAPPAPPRPAPSAGSAPAARADTSFVTKRPRPAGAADATVVDQRPHTSRLPAGAAPAPAIAAPAPPSPGRIRDDAPHAPVKASGPPPPPAPVATATTSVVAGDLGRVFGSARAKIEKRIEDAIEQVEGR